MNKNMNADATIQIVWVKMDRLGSVKAAYRASNGKLFWPKYIGCVWGNLGEKLLRNSPDSAQHFDLQSLGPVCQIGNRFYVTSSKVFKPLAAFMSAESKSNPTVAMCVNKGAWLAKRSDLVEVFIPK